MRIGLAIVAAVAGAYVLFALVSPLGADWTWRALEHFFPTESGVTKNTNTNYWGNLLMLPLAVAAGMVVGALVYDPHLSKNTEAFTAIAVFVLLMAVSGVNFWSHDALINVNGQAAIDALLSFASLVVVGLLLRWTPSMLTATAIQRIALFLVATFGFVLPLFYATNLLLIRFGYPHPPRDIPAWMAFVSGAVGFAVAFGPNLKRAATYSKDKSD